MFAKKAKKKTPNAMYILVSNRLSTLPNTIVQDISYPSFKNPMFLKQKKRFKKSRNGGGLKTDMFTLSKTVLCFLSLSLLSLTALECIFRQ